MKVLRETKRGCGHRQEGALYLVTELGGGELSRWSPIDPPVPYEGEHFRTWVEIDLGETLEQREVVLAGVSAERAQTEDARAWEVEQFGMPLQTRLRVGIGKGLSPEELGGRLGQLMMGELVISKSVGHCLRALNEMEIPRLDGELARAWQAAQKQDAGGLLASCWRMSKKVPPSRQAEANDHLMRVMVLVGATEDAMALREKV